MDEQAGSGGGVRWLVSGSAVGSLGFLAWAIEWSDWWAGRRGIGWEFSAAGCIEFEILSIIWRTCCTCCVITMIIITNGKFNSHMVTIHGVEGEHYMKGRIKPISHLMIWGYTLSLGYSRLLLVHWLNMFSFLPCHQNLHFQISSWLSGIKIILNFLWPLGGVILVFLVCYIEAEVS